MTTRRKKAVYKPYWHYIILHLNEMAKGNETPLERICLRHGYKLMPTVPTIKQTELSPFAGEVSTHGDATFEKGRIQGKLNAWEMAFSVLARAHSDR